MVDAFVCGTKGRGFDSLHSPRKKRMEKRPRLSRRVGRPRVGSLAIRIRKEKKQASTRARWVSRRTRRVGIEVWISVDNSVVGYQRVEKYEGRGPLGAKRSRGVDGIARCFVRLTTRRTPRSRLASRDGIGKEEKSYYARFVGMEGRIRAVFVVTDVRWFYVSFEAVLIPMYMRIGVWGTRERKVRAGYRFFRYTLVGSVRMLVGVRYRNNRYGTTDMERLKWRCNSSGDRKREEGPMRRRWRGFFASLAVKVPMVPVHIWLPEAHVEAPTGGSVRLAGILLKVGTYGMRRRLRERRPEATVYFTPRVYVRAAVGMVYPARTAMRQTDRKRIVAYASVSHMNMTLVGRFSRTEQGVEGGVLQMVSHGLVAGGRFMGIGVRYDRYHTRRITYYGGVAQTMPRYASVLRRFTRGNIGRPGTSAFVGEWRRLVGIVQTNHLMTRRSARGMVLGGGYSLWRYNRLAYGNRKRTYTGVGSEEMTDRKRREMRMMRPLRRRMRRLGVDPGRVRDKIKVSCVARVENARRRG
jgi:proton-translocating NADH-quinone oxidoreductase chain M